MANSEMIQPDRLSALPAEIRAMIWELLSLRNEVWVGFSRSRGRDSGVIQRWIFGRPQHTLRLSDEHADGSRTEESFPHPLFRLNRLISQDLRTLWESRLRDARVRLEVDYRIIGLPHQIFHGVTYLTLTMKQAAEQLQVVVPHVSPDLDDWHIPTTQLVLAHAPNVRFLRILWNQFDTEEENILPGLNFQAAFIRLQYFSRSFEVAIHYTAFDFIEYIDDPDRGDADHNMTDENYYIDDRTRDHAGGVSFRDSPFDHALARLNDIDVGLNIRWAGHNQTSELYLWDHLVNFGWHSDHDFSDRDSPQYRATVAAHPYHDHVPLGFVEEFEQGATQLVFGNIDELRSVRREPRPQPDLPPRRATPRSANPQEEGTQDVQTTN